MATQCHGTFLSLTVYVWNRVTINPTEQRCKEYFTSGSMSKRVFIQSKICIKNGSCHAKKSQRKKKYASPSLMDMDPEFTLSRILPFAVCQCLAKSILVPVPTGKEMQTFTTKGLLTKCRHLLLVLISK